MSIYIDRILPQIRSMISIYFEDQPRTSLTFERLVHYGLDGGELYRARTSNVKGGLRSVPKTISLNKRAVTFNEPSSKKFAVLYSSDAEELYHVYRSVSTSMLPSTGTSK